MNKTLPILFAGILLLNACASTAPKPKSGDTFMLPDIPTAAAESSAIPYPDLNTMTQIERLGMQVERLEREMENTNQRLQQLEKQNKTPRHTNRKVPAQRLDDQKLKSTYLANGGTAPSEADSADQNETRLYNQALKYYQRNNYAAAAAVLKGADGGNGSESARRNMYLLLQSQQRMGNCESVIEIGGRFANRFRNSPQAPDALFSIGQCQYKLQQKDIARNTWRKLIQSYPGSAAAKRAVLSGAATVVAWGGEPDVLVRLKQGESIGTLFTSAHSRVAARKQWLLGHVQTAGSLTVDSGAAKALTEQHASLLPVGCIRADGHFHRGELVAILDTDGKEIARGLTNYSSGETAKILQTPSERIAEKLGYAHEDELIHRDNMASHW